MSSELDTRKHIMMVAKYLNTFAAELMKRAIEHDASKLEEPEKAYFDKYTPLLAHLTYGSEEYKETLKQLKPALDHHYATNKHHPEFNDINGYSVQTLNDPIKSMDLFDIVEMICDWLAATKRHNDGCIGKSITINKKRFNLDDQLEMLLRNTAAILEDKSE